MRNLLPALLPLAALVISAPAIAQNYPTSNYCQEYDSYQIDVPTVETRVITTADIRFEIPANYRTISDAYGIQVYGPNEFEYVSCLRENQVGTDNFYTTATVRMDNRDEQRVWADAVENASYSGGGLMVGQTDFGRYVVYESDYLGMAAVTYTEPMSPNRTVVVEGNAFGTDVSNTIIDTVVRNY